MPTNQTPNYGLSQWEKSDKVLMEDFNVDNAKLDAALKAGADARAAMQAALNGKGSCSVGTFTYTGTGSYGQNNPTRITFPRKPVLFVILGGDLMIGSQTRGAHSYSISGGCVVGGIGVTWSGNTASFYSDKPERQMNENGRAYQVIAFYAES